MTRWLAVAALLVVTGCQCGREAEIAEPVAEAPTATEDPAALPRARRALPTATPALTLTVTTDAFELSNDGLLASWPPADRERARAAAPPGDGAWPQVRDRVEESAPAGSYRIDALARAFERAAAIDRARAGSAQVPVAYAMRVGADVPWQRVLEALYTAGQTGWAEPRFVLRAPEGDAEVYLSIPIPRASVADVAAEARARAVVDEALRQLGEGPLPAGADRPGSAAGDPSAPLELRVAASGSVRASIGAQPLAPGCGSIHETAIDVLPSLDPEAVARCIDAAGGAGPPIRGARLAVAGTIPFGGVIPVLEALRARHDDVWILVGD